MKTSSRRPVRRRSQTHLGQRSRAANRRRTTSQLKISFKDLALPALGVQCTLAMVAIAVLAAILATLCLSPQYAIANVEVQGNEGVATQDVIDAVAFARNQNAFLLRRADVAAAVKGLPGVESVQVRILIPDRLYITVRDTRPSVAWVVGNLIYWIDHNGIVLDPQSVTTEHPLTIKDLTGKTYRRGDKVDQAAIKTAQQLMIIMPKEIQGFEYQREGEITVVGNAGWRAVFSTRGDLNKQIDALHRLLARIRAVNYVDVRVPDAITYR